MISNDLKQILQKKVLNKCKKVVETIDVNLEPDCDIIDMIEYKELIFIIVKQNLYCLEKNTEFKVMDRILWDISFALFIYDRKNNLLYGQDPTFIGEWITTYSPRTQNNPLREGRDILLRGVVKKYK